jgi:hypothetical protein
MLRAVRETETTQENIRDWLELDEGDLGFQLDRGTNCCRDIFLCIFISTICIIKFFIFYGYLFASLIQIIG